MVALEAAREGPVVNSRRQQGRLGGNGVRPFSVACSYTVRPDGTNAA